MAKQRRLLILFGLFVVILFIIVLYTPQYEALTNSQTKYVNSRATNKPAIARHTLPVLTAKPQHLYETDPSSKYDDPTVCEDYYNCLQENTEDACAPHKSDYC